MTIRLKVCALTNQDPVRLRRLIESVKRNVDHTMDVSGFVVCNTLDTDYVGQAQAAAEDFGWDFHVTESNGKPGRGKNSALQLFTQEYKDYDYLLLMDGDDFLYNCALQAIERVATRTTCDVFGLQTNDILTRVKYPAYSGIDIAYNGEIVRLYSWFDKQQNLYAMHENYQKVVRTNKLGDHSTPDRIILFSHEAAKRLRCSEELPVYEDYVLSLNAQAEYLKGNLLYFNTSSTNIYVYDRTNEKSTCAAYDKHVGDWSAHDGVFKEEVSKLDSILGDFHASEVPFVCINMYPRNLHQFKVQQVIELLKMYPLK